MTTIRESVKKMSINRLQYMIKLCTEELVGRLEENTVELNTIKLALAQGSSVLRGVRHDRG